MSDKGVVLIVDDDPGSRATLEGLLLNEGYQLNFTANGADGLAQAAACLPDLILLDVMMPAMDGFEVCRHLRADPVLAEVPVILLTALDDRASRLAGIEAGADDFIAKPFDRVELRTRIRTITRLNRYRRLLAERAKLASVLELTPDGLLIVDSDGRIMLANPAAQRLLDSADEAGLRQRQLTDFVAPMHRATFARELALAFSVTEPQRIETLLVGVEGRQVPVEMLIRQLVWDGRPAAQIAARDITDRKRAELLEEERHHLAYDIHDGLAQIATAAHQHLQSFASRYRSRSFVNRNELNQALDLTRRSVGEIRRVIAGLRPTVLDDFGLTAALQLYVDTMQAEGWDVSYRETLGVERLNPATEIVVYRVAVEALTNVRKHAGVTPAQLGLERLERGLRLSVRDWGRGFNQDAPADRARLGERIGLRGMRERIALLGGHWQIVSAPGAGVSIVAEVPLPAAATGGAA